MDTTTPSSPPLLLVVDDREENLEAMQALLGADQHWQLRCCASGEEALRCLLQEDVSLVLLDVQMPGMDGYEVAELMRTNPKTRHTPIIFISAIAHTQDSILRGYHRGAVDFILKPFDATVLRQKIYNLLEFENNRRALLRLNQQLERERSFNDAILTHAGEGIMVIGADGLIAYANPAMAQMLASDLPTLKGQGFLGLLVQAQNSDSKDEYKNWQESPFYHHWQKGEVYRQHEAFLTRKDGSVCPVSLSCSPLPPSQNSTVMIVHDMSAEQKLRQKLESLIITDPLTGLLNRRGFHQAAEAVLARAKRGGQPLILMFIDLDGFKHINDSLGHDAGDALLCHIAHQLKNTLRPYDVIARMGGDEFTILLEGMKQGRDGVHVADKLLKLISQRAHVAGEDISVSVSIGIACYPNDGENVDNLLRSADMAMYEAKKNGRQQYRFHSSQMIKRAKARMEIVQYLHQAVDDQLFTLAYQPQFYLDSGKLRGFEALLRWPTGNALALAPSQFIAHLEESRLIQPVGQWIFKEGIARLSDVRRNFGSDIILSLNVSPVQFAQSKMVEELAHILDEHDLPAKQLELEVTESVLLQNLDITHRHLHHLQQLGISVAVDDFGTGYSSLAYLSQFALDVLKIDQLFVANMLESARDATVVTAILDLSKNLGLQVIAEGVETEQQRQWLVEHHCTIMQGYLASPALPFEEACQIASQLDWSVL